MTEIVLTWTASSSTRPDLKLGEGPRCRVIRPDKRADSGGFTELLAHPAPTDRQVRDSDDISLSVDYL
jgi:hypothetical protein